MYWHKNVQKIANLHSFVAVYQMFGQEIAMETSMFMIFNLSYNF